MATSNLGAIVSIDRAQNSVNSYTVKQSKLQSPFALVPSGRGSNLRDQISFGPCTVDFTIDTDKESFGVSVTVFGIGIGNFYGSFTSGIGVNVDLLAASGAMNFYVKDSALYVVVKIHVVFPSYDYNDTYEITNWRSTVIQPRASKL